MTYEVRDGVMWRVDGFGVQIARGTVDEAVASALDLLRAAGWTVETSHRTRRDNGAPVRERYDVARSPWREVSDD